MTSEKCCFYLKLETGCLLLGVTTFVLSFIPIIITAVFILPEHVETLQKLTPNATVSNLTHHHVKHVLDLVSDKSVKTVVVGFVLIVCLLWMVISVLLIIGIVKKKASCVMTYFLFGISISMMFLLGGLLLMISKFWITSLFTFIWTLAYIKCLISVYAAYDKLRQLKAADDMDQLIIDDDTMIEY